MLPYGICITDDINKVPIPGVGDFVDLVDPQNPYPLSFLEKWSIAEVTAELSTSCYGGMLMLQAMGLGGWMFNGIEPFSLLGASDNRGLGFRSDKDERWTTPNVTGLEGVFESLTPPHVNDMGEAVERVVERKFGEGGPFHQRTPGYYKDTREVRSRAKVHDERFKECVRVQAQYILDTFGRFPGTVPAVFVMQYLQAQHIDLDFYDSFFEKGSYLGTHEHHMERWHRPNIK
jgi:hypothetical protein